MWFSDIKYKSNYQTCLFFIELPRLDVVDDAAGAGAAAAAAVVLHLHPGPEICACPTGD